MILKRSGARQLLAEDQMPGFSWSYTESTKREVFTITLEAEETAGGKARYYRIEFPVEEAKRLAEYIAQRLTKESDPNTVGLYLRKSGPRALRDLATQMEG